jgi:hypothetical protein
LASLAGGAGLFLAFRFGIELTGTAVVGGWALIQSAFFLSRVNDSGTGINITRMVAVSRIEEGRIPLFDVVSVGFVLSVVPVLILGAILVAPVDWLLVHHFHSTLPGPVVLHLVVLSFATAVLSSLSGLLLSIVEGAGGLFYRYLITIASNVVLGASAYPLLAYFGAEGLGMIYVAAAGVQLLGAAIVLPIIVHRKMRSSAPKKELIASLWRENLKTSGMALARLTFEPWTKFLVASGAGIPAVAALDLAFRVTTQVRVAVQAAMQPLLAMGARSSMSSIDHIESQYSQANKLVIRANVCIAGALTAGGPLIQYLGFGSLSSDFLQFFILLVLANSINAIGVVGYYFSISGGAIGRILWIHVVMMIINLVLGAIGVVLIGPWAAVLAYAISFAYGGIALAQPWMDVAGLTWRRVARQELGGLLAACAVIALIAFTTIWPGGDGLYRAGGGLILVGASTAVGIALLAIFAGRNWRLFT